MTFVRAISKTLAHNGLAPARPSGEFFAGLGPCLRGLFALAALMTVGAMNASAALVFDFANVTGALFRFDGTGAGGNFSFSNGVGGVDFLVTSQNSDWPGSVLNYTGDFVAPVGGWTVAATGNPATVSGVGTLVLRNAANTATLSGDLVWNNLGTLGGVGGLNIDGVMNFTNLNLVGADANLSALQAIGGAQVVVSFQNVNVGAGTASNGDDCTGLLGQMRCGGISTGSYSGTLTAEASPEVPEPGTFALLGGALLALGFSRRRR